MKPIAEFLSELRRLQIKIWTDEGRLRYSALQETIAPDLLEEMRSRKSEIIAFLEQVNSDTPAPIQPISRDKDLPLSFAQQRLWFLDQLAGKSATYNFSQLLSLKGQLNLTALEQTFQAIVERHETLRTGFQVVNDSPVQVIVPQIKLTLPIIDLQELSTDEQSARVQQLAQQEAQRPFDLTQAPLLRVTLLRLSEQSHILLLTLHHIIFDGWSMGIVMRELSCLYQAFFYGKPNPLPKLPIQYADFAHWQREWLQGEVLANQLNYWKRQLAEVPTLLELPTDRPRPTVQTFRGSRHQLQLTTELTNQLKTLSKQSNVTLFMTLLTTLATLLHRYSSQCDLAIGSPIANRNRHEIESIIGFFVNTLVLRIDLNENPTFLELLARVRQIALDAYAHQDVPFEKLVEEFQSARSLSYSPLFQVMFILQNAPSSNLELPDLTLTILDIDTGTAKFDLLLSMTETEQGLIGLWEYSTDLFDGETINRMAGHFQTLLEEIVASPEQRISQLPLLRQSERHQLLVEWNDTQTDYPQDACVHQLFEAQVEQTPDAVAVIFEGQQLMYRELNAKANQLAHHLRLLGVSSNVLVGLCVERSLEMVIGLLGILKAGGAYVALDPAYPQERLAYMLENAQTPVVLTQSRLVPLLSKSGVSVICLDTDWEALAQHSEDNPSSGTRPDRLAYAIYTSGSTGKPKGVAMSHRPLVNLLAWQLQNTRVPSPKTLQFAPISFDVSFQECFSTWCCGGTLVLISDTIRRDAVALLQFLEDNAIERLFLPFVALQHLAEVADERGTVPTHLREMIAAGEQLQISRAIAQWFSQLQDCTLVNQYGPSESHVVTAFTLPGSPQNWPKLPPIGRPIANTQIYLLDSHLQPVPIGVPGELYIGGISLAKGYLNRPELTKEKFIANPFNNEPDAGLYKTGDLARYLANGNIEFIGRIDNQVKIRGFRIEIGEIEATLSQHPAIKETVVIALEDQADRKRLVAYFVPNQEPANARELRSFLKTKLPDYMIPSAFVRLDAIPITPNGKVDRRALPSPEIADTLSIDFAPPSTSVEEKLSAIWLSVLKLKRVGIHDNFFELGGHSLLATQVVSRIHKAFDMEFPLRYLFEAPTIAQLSDRIETILWAKSAQPSSTDNDLEEGEL